jgi:hypothetical protein
MAAICWQRGAACSEAELTSLTGLLHQKKEHEDAAETDILLQSERHLEKNTISQNGRVQHILGPYIPSRFSLKSTGARL